MFSMGKIIILGVCIGVLISLWSWTATHENRDTLENLRNEVAQMNSELRDQRIRNSQKVDKLHALSNSRHALAEHAIVHYELVRPDEILVYVE